MDGHGACDVLETILKVFPLDTYIEKPVNLMEMMLGGDVETPIWADYIRIVAADDRGAAGASAIIDTRTNLAVFYVQHTLNPREEFYQPCLRNAVYSYITKK